MPRILNNGLSCLGGVIEGNSLCPAYVRARRAKLRLDLRESVLAKRSRSGASIIVDGNPLESEIIRRIRSSDADVVMPPAEHQNRSFSMWLAGGGIKPGHVHSETDELGLNVARAPAHVHDLNATLLHLPGLDHKRLT